MKEISQEELSAAYNALPRPIRAYLVSAAPYEFAQAEGQKYGLHVDVVGGLSYFMTYLLCGFINPLQFQKALTELGIPVANAQEIIGDLNEKVFKPLQEEVRNAPPEEPRAREVVVPSPVPQPAPRPAVVPQPQPMPQAPRPIPVQPPAPRPMPPPAPVQMQRPAPPPAPIQPVAPPQVMPVPPVAPRPVPMPPPVAPRPMSVPVQPQQPPPVPSQPRPNTSSQQSPNREELHNLLKQYGVDPYRESPE